MIDSRAFALAPCHRAFLQVRRMALTAAAVAIVMGSVGRTARGQVVTATTQSTPSATAAFGDAYTQPTTKLDGFDPGAFFEYDEATQPVTNTFLAGDSQNIVGAALNPLGPAVYLVVSTTTGTSTSSALQQVCFASGTNCGKTTPVGSNPLGIAVDPATSTIYVANHDDSTITILGTANLQAIATVAVPGNPKALAIDSSLGKVFVLLDGSSNLAVLNESTHAVSTIPIAGYGPTGLVVNPSTHRVFVLTQGIEEGVSGPGLVSILDGSAQSLITARYAGLQPIKIAQNLANGAVYVINTTENGMNGAPTLSYVNGNPPYDTLYPHGVQLAEAAGSSGVSADVPVDLAVNATTGKVYVATFNTTTQTDNLTVVNGATFQPAFVPLGQPATTSCGIYNTPCNPQPAAVVVLNETTNKAFIVANNQYGSANVSVVDGSGGSTGYPTMFPANLYFSGLSVGHASAPQTLYLANTGGAPMTLINLEFNSIYPTALEQSNDCPSVIPAGAVCTLSVSYTPTTATPSLQDWPFYAETLQPAPYALATVDIIAQVGGATP